MIATLEQRRTRRGTTCQQRHKEELYRNMQERAPFFEALKNYTKKDMVAFHTPGHKYGKGIDPEFIELVGENMFKIDLCELPEVDNLHDPEHVIKESQELAALAYGADYSFFLVNGSTTGNNAMVLSVCDPGDKILIPRNVHKSVLGGILLSGAVPVYIEPVWDSEMGVAHGITTEAVQATFEEHPDAKALLIVNPTYYGVTIDIAAIADICHKLGKPLLVDEAHGPHFHFHPELPQCALCAGADLVVQSTHKIISGMTQSSLFHVRKGQVNVQRVRKVLQILQSTSPNYILMASLDTARRQMALHGEELLEKTIKMANWARNEINKIPDLHSFGEEKVGRPGVHSFDPTKVSINTTQLGISGFDFLDLMHEHYNIQSEMATLHNVLEIVTLGNDWRDMERLVEAIRNTANMVRNDSVKRAVLESQRFDLPLLPEAVMTPREAFYSKTKKIPFDQSAGHICTELVAPYPPGISILVPGERISQEHVDYIKLIHKHGGFINGPDDIRLRTIKVVDQD